MKIITATAVLGLVACLTACGSLPTPVIDQTGVDQGKYSRDLSDCYNEAKSAVIAFNPISKCMTRKGYKVLQELG